MKSDTTGLRVCLTIGAALLGFSLQAAPRQAAAADASDAVQARGVSAVRFHDFSKPIDELPETEWITRWRLQKQDPTAAMSPPRKPIVYYFDPAIPKAAPAGTPEERALLRVTQDVALQSMMKLGAARDGAPEAKDYVLDQLNQLADDLKSRSDPDRLTAASYRQSAREIQHYLNNPEANAPKSITPEWGKGPRSRFPEPPGPPL
jgi:hypothetical protein